MSPAIFVNIIHAKQNFTLNEHPFLKNFSFALTPNLKKLHHHNFLAASWTMKPEFQKTKQPSIFSFFQVSLENATYLKTQLAGQLEDARRRAEDDERRRSVLESQLHQVEIELESIRVQLEEESEARLDLERQLVKSQGEVQVYRSKYESEAAARVEEVEELRRKYNIRISEQEEHIEALLVKVRKLILLVMNLKFSFFSLCSNISDYSETFSK